MIKRGGFSLFEVLVAFAIMSLVLATLIPGQGRLLGRTANVAERLLAKDFAMSKVALLAVVLPPAPGRNEYIYRDWRVVETITEGQTGDGTLTFLRLRVEIAATSGDSLAQAEALWVGP